jgi:hypothetical protein
MKVSVQTSRVGRLGVIRCCRKMSYSKIKAELFKLLRYKTFGVVWYNYLWDR